MYLFINLYIHLSSLESEWWPSVCLSSLAPITHICRDVSPVLFLSSRCQHAVFLCQFPLVVAHLWAGSFGAAWMVEWMCVDHWLWGAADAVVQHLLLYLWLVSLWVEWTYLLSRASREIVLIKSLARWVLSIFLLLMVKSADRSLRALKRLRIIDEAIRVMVL